MLRYEAETEDNAKHIYNVLRMMGFTYIYVGGSERPCVIWSESYTARAADLLTIRCMVIEHTLDYVKQLAK